MENKNCPISGCKNIRQSNGKGRLKMCCRRHTKIKRMLGYNQGELPNKKKLHEEFYK